MPLFECAKCHCVENTALSGFWEQEMKAHQETKPLEPICSECETGEWHGKFPKQLVSDTQYFQRGKFLHHPDWDAPKP